jgi:protein-tyrosine phosphatase
LVAVIDLHCHVLHGIDDGPRELEGSLAICRASAELGVKTIVATPHVSWTYENESRNIAARVEFLNEQLRRAHIDLEILTGAEVSIFKAVEMTDEELHALCLGGGPWMLAEPPFTAGAAGLDKMISQLRARGHNLLIAHPERCPSYLLDRSQLEQLVGDGVLLSITAGSLAGRFGKDSKRFAEGLLRDGMVHNVASDAHDLQRRPPGMSGELADAGYGALTSTLCDEIPRALIEGSTPPRPQAVAPPKRGLSRLFG